MYIFMYNVCIGANYNVFWFRSKQLVLFESFVTLQLAMKTIEA